MKLYGRSGEIKLLQRQKWLAEEQHSRMTLLVGRRLSGKTALICDAFAAKPFLYFDVAGKVAPILLEGYKKQVQRKLDIYVPQSIINMRLFIDFMFGMGEKHSFTVVLDNFNEIAKRDPDLYSYIAEMWKKKRKVTHINLVIVVSNPYLIPAIFENSGSPMFNCLDMKLDLKFFTIQELRQLLQSKNPKMTKDDLLTMYMITGGCPHFVFQAIENDVLTKDKMVEYFLSGESSFAKECEKIISDTLGRNSEVYMSILQLIACGVKNMSEMEDNLGFKVGGHLAKLETDYGLVIKRRPILAEEGSRNVVRYEISDQFLAFWLRYIESNVEAAMTGDWNAIREIFNSDYKDWAKDVLKRWFCQKFIEENKMEGIGGDWRSVSVHKRISRGFGLANTAVVKPVTKKQPAYELDIVYLDKAQGSAMIADVEYDAVSFKKEPFLKRIDTLKKGDLKDFVIDSRLFTLQDM